MLNGHGDDVYRYKDIRINFSSNVYNHFDHEGLYCYLADKLDNVASYPEPSPTSLEAELAMMLGIKPDEVCVTNGATEAIYFIAQTFRRSKTAILMPTFSEYADACRIHEHTLCSIYALDQIPERAQMVWLCNPNNPTGSVIDKDELMKCFKAHEDVIFVLDASYAPFTLKPQITPKEAVGLPNVIMLHSMTKEYAVPGLRIGYITASKALLQNIRLQRMPWSVNQVAIDAGHYLLAHEDEYRLDVDTLVAERERVAEKLQKLGCIETWPSDTHILLCKLRMGKASSLKEYLATQHGILIRDAGNFEGLDSSFFRIAVQEKEENDELIDAIGEWLFL
ncbi:MAG: pyridoxal phosphate-dependent class II aminotransferase [Bacteroidaceae bacterium]|nr:pyridoxal phosphate-dependent class II aminotransferase [Bacteroidaceae bacterium]